MTHMFLKAATAIAAVMSATAASAVPYLFVVTSVNGIGDDFLNYRFSIDSDPTPGATDAGLASFTINNVTTTGTRANFGPYTINYAFTFYEALAPGANDAGFDNGRSDNSYYSVQLFTGSYLDPTFRKGSFDLFDFPGGSKIATLDISGPAATAVPEPASWALMLAGFGLTGYALRRRGAVTVAA